MRQLPATLLLFSTLTASTALAEDPQSPAALAALRQQLNKDVQAEHSAEVNDPKNKQPIVRQKTITAGQMHEIRTQMAADAQQGENADKPILGSSIGGIGGAATTETEPSSTRTAPLTPDMTTPNAFAPQTTYPSSPKPATEQKAIAAVLSDGTQALFRPDGSVSIITQDGRYHKPPDGVLTLRDGTTFAVENGMRKE